MISCIVRVLIIQSRIAGMSMSSKDVRAGRAVWTGLNPLLKSDECAVLSAAKTYGVGGGVN